MPIRLRGPNGERTVAAAEFFLGTYWTALEADEIMTEIRIPAFGPRTGYAYCKLKRKQGDWATAASAVVLRLDGDVCAEARIGLTNVAPMALSATDAAAALVGRVSTRRPSRRPRRRSWRSANRPRTCAATSNTRPTWPAR